MRFMDYRCFELTGLPLQNPHSNIFETDNLSIEPRYEPGPIKDAS